MIGIQNKAVLLQRVDGAVNRCRDLFELTRELFCR